MSVIAILSVIALAGTVQAATQVMTNTATGGRNNWNQADNWSNAVPTGIDSAVVGAGLAAQVDDNTTPTYSGGLTLETGSSLQIGWTSNNASNKNALGTGPITMQDGSVIISRTGLGTYTFNQPFVMAGDATIWAGISTANHHSQKTFAGGFSGPGQLTYNGVNNTWFIFNTASPAWTGGLRSNNAQNQPHQVRADADGVFGTGDVAVNTNCSLQIQSGVSNAINDASTLFLNGARSSRLATKLIMNGDESVDELLIDGHQAATGTYTSASGSWISGGGSLTVLSGPTDSTAPTVDSMVDNFNGGPIYEDVSQVTYTVTFSEDMDGSSVDTNDFSNAGTANVTIGAVTETTDHPYPSVFIVEVLPSSTGTLQLQIPVGADLNDYSSNALDTATAILDDTIISINAGSSPPTTITNSIAGPGGNGDTWNNPENWDLGVVPIGPYPAIVGSGVVAQVQNADTPAYTGTLTLTNDATLRINNVAGSEIAVEGPPSITMHAGSKISLAADRQIDFPAVMLAGNASFDNPSNASDHDTRNFNGPVTGPGTLTLVGRNNNHFRLKTTNSFMGNLVCNAVDRWNLYFDAVGSAGPGDVTVNGRASDNRSARVNFNATNAMADTATLYLNGGGYTGNGSQRIVMNQDDTILALWIDGVQQTAGTYTKADDFISDGNGTLTVLTSPAAITNSGAVNVEETTADLTGTLDGPQAEFTVSVYWGTNDNADSTAWLADAGASSAVVGSYSNVVGHSVTGSVSALTPGTVYYYTMVASNALTTIWAGPNASFITPAPPATPVVTTAGGATDVAAGAARLNGELTAGGSADAYICWGENDGGTAGTGGWQHVIPMGSAMQSVPFSTNLTGLLYGIEYDYRVYATNANGEAWSAAATFMTLPPAGGWSPADTNTALWLDADDASTITLDGGTVSQWDDKSGNDRHATQATTGSQPTDTARGMNTRHVLTFDGVSDYFNVDLDFLAGVSHSAFIVTKPTTYTDIYGAANHSAAANSLHVGFRNDTSYRMNYWGNDWYGTISASFHAGNGNILNYVWQPGVSKEIFANGSSEGTHANAGTIGTMSGGGRIGQVVNHGHYGGDIAEIVMLTGTVDADDRQLFEGYLAHKWGLESFLPGGHPYASEAPGAGAISIANVAAVNVGATTADLVGALNATQSVFDVTVYWSMNDNADAGAWLADGTASSLAIGTYTNVSGLSVTGSVSTLSSGATYYYTMVVSNEATNIWASPNANFGTLTAPVVDNAGGATNVGPVSATLRGELTAGGAATAYIVWGDDTPGTPDSMGAWDHVVSIGSVNQGMLFSTEATGLSSPMTYYYRCYVSNDVDTAWSGVTNFTTPDVINTMTNNTGGNDSWNVADNWSRGHVPTGSDYAVVSNGIAAKVDNGFTPTYDGGLRLGTNSSLQIGWTGNNAGNKNALGAGPITMNDGSAIISRTGLGNYDFTQGLFMAGNGRIWAGISTANHHTTKKFSGGISGPGQLIYNGVNNTWFDFNVASPSWTGGFLSNNPQNQGHQVKATADGGFGTGDVAINTNCSLQIAGGVTNTIDDGAALYLNGAKSSRLASKLVLDSSETVNEFWIDGNQAATGTYTSAHGAISGGGTLTVLSGPSDTTPPTVESFVDNFNGGPIYEDVPVVTYTVTFSEDMDGATVDTNDFSNAGTATVVIGTVTEITEHPAQSVFRVEVLPSSTGALQLQINAGADLKDYYGNPLDTTAAILDDTVITIAAGSSPTTTIIGSAAGPGGAGDTWNNPANWDSGIVPIGPYPAAITNGLTAQVENADTPAYDGSLTLMSGSTLKINNTGGDANLRALGGGPIIMHDGSAIDTATASDPRFPAIELNGTNTFKNSSNTADWDSRYFDAAISGTGTLAVNGRNGNNYYLNTTNTFSGGFLGQATDRWKLYAKSGGCFGTGDVTITGRHDGRSAQLYLDVADTIDDGATLTLNGKGFDQNNDDRITIAAGIDEVVGALIVDSVLMAPGTYDNMQPWLSGDGTLTVVRPPAPGLTIIVR